MGLCSTSLLPVERLMEEPIKTLKALKWNAFQWAYTPVVDSMER